MLKNKIVDLTLLIMSIFMFFACNSVPSSSVSFDVDVQYETETPIVTLNVQPTWKSDLFLGSGFGGFTCTFTNMSEKVVKVVWEESSINYSGSSYVPFVNGQKYADAQTPMSPTAIAKGGTLSKDVYSSSQPYYISGQYGGWSMNPIEAKSVQLVLMVKSGDKQEYITVTCSAIYAE